MSKLKMAAMMLTLLPFALACGHRQEVLVDEPGPDRRIEVQRGAQGTEIELHRDQAESHLDQAGRDLGHGAREAGQALAEGARGLAQQVGQEVGPAAQKAGEQLRQGAHDVGQKLGPAAREAGQELRDAGREVGQKVGPALSDTAITTSIKTKLLADSTDGLNNIKDISVTTSAGEVTLTGKVDRHEQKTAAEKIALGVNGVRRVVNQIQVGG